MPDTLTPERLAELRQMHSTPVHRPMPCSTCETLAHIDALTAAVEALPCATSQGESVDQAAVLAILRGEQ